MATHNVRIIYSASLITKCERAISKLIGYNVFLSKKPEGRISTFLCGVICSDPRFFHTFQDCKEGERGTWCLARIHDSNVWPSWIGIRLKFEHENHNFALRSVSVLLAIDGNDEFSPLYRAEWDYSSYKDIGSDHAQPHWHALIDKKEITPVFESEIYSASDSIKEFSPLKVDSVIDTGKIHLPMSAHWHDFNNNTYKHNLKDEAALTWWLDNVIKYLFSQLVHLKRKHKAPVKDFD